MSTLHGWPHTFPPVAVFGEVADLTALPDFKPAKRGDLAAAERVVRIFLDRRPYLLDALLQARRCAAVVYADSSSGNRLPEAFAHAIASTHGLQPWRLNQTRSVVSCKDTAKDTNGDSNQPAQSVPHHRAHESAIDRFLARPCFEWSVPAPKVPPCCPVLLLDDVVTTGGSLSEMRRFIAREGGWPQAACALVSTPSRSYRDDGTELVPDARTKADLLKIWPEVGNYLAEHGVCAGRVDCLTQSEMRLLIREARKDSSRETSRVSLATATTP